MLMVTQKCKLESRNIKSEVKKKYISTNLLKDFVTVTIRTSKMTSIANWRLLSYKLSTCE